MHLTKIGIKSLCKYFDNPLIPFSYSGILSTKMYTESQSLSTCPKLGIEIKNPIINKICFILCRMFLTMHANGPARIVRRWRSQPPNGVILGGGALGERGCPTYFFYFITTRCNRAVAGALPPNTVILGVGALGERGTA